MGRNCGHSLGSGWPGRGWQDYASFFKILFIYLYFIVVQVQLSPLGVLGETNSDAEACRSSKIVELLYLMLF